MTARVDDGPGPEPRDHEADEALSERVREAREDEWRDARALMARADRYAADMTAAAVSSAGRLGVADAALALVAAELHGADVGSPEWVRLMGVVRDRGQRVMGCGIGQGRWAS